MIFWIQKVLHNVDVFAKDLQSLIASRNLTDIVDIIFVSDHGMTDTSHPELVYMDDILGEGFSQIEHEDGQCLSHIGVIARLSNLHFARLALHGTAVLPRI